MTSEVGNEEDNVENIDVVASNDVPEGSESSDVSEVELLPQDDDGDFDDEDVLDVDIDEEDSDESESDDSDNADEDDSDGEFDDEDDDSDGEFDDEVAKDAENTDYDAQFTVTVEVVEPVKQTVVIETLPITGEPRVDDALSRLSDLEGLPVHEHGDVFEDVRRRLHGTLSDLSGQ